MISLKKVFFMFIVPLTLCQGAFAKPFSHFHFPIWVDYAKVNFDDLPQTRKTEKLQLLFEDLADFCKRRETHKVIVKILDPESFDFFNPEKFNERAEDNFYYWAVKLNKCCKLEVLFDAKAFNLSPSGPCHFFSSLITSTSNSFLKTKIPEGTFENLVDKLSWISTINDMYDPSFSKSPLVKAVVIQPEEMSDEAIQATINTIDQYRCNASEEFPANHFPNLKTGSCFRLDQKDFLLANLARFPATQDLREEPGGQAGVVFTKNFPAQKSSLLGPKWRPSTDRSLLDLAYIDMGDERLISSVYQDRSCMSNPNENIIYGAARASENLGNQLRGGFTRQGPGRVTICKGSSEVQGLATFFKTGKADSKDGLIKKKGIIEIHPPYTKEVIRRTVISSPTTNDRLEVSEPFSEIEDITNAKYHLNVLPFNWGIPTMSRELIAKLHFVFSCEFSPPNRLFVGNWSRKNFVKFLKNDLNKSGLVNRKIFVNLQNKKSDHRSHKSSKTIYLPFIVTKPYANWGINQFVVRSFTMIPNEKSHPGVNWNLDNKVHR